MRSQIISGLQTPKMVQIDYPVKSKRPRVRPTTSPSTEFLIVMQPAKKRNPRQPSITNTHCIHSRGHLDPLAVIHARPALFFAFVLGDA